ncbi:RHS repeat-associated core domain-containing protein, partial [Myceligenerans halotolerans]
TDLDVTFTYDDAGNILSQTDVPGIEGLEADGQCFAYDGLNRLTEAWTPAVSGATADCAAAKDVATLAGPAPYWDSWAFEGNGNRQEWTHRTAEGTTTTAYEYDPTSPHQVTGVTVDAPSAAITEAFTYDLAGNTTGRTTVTEGAAATSTGETETRTAIQGLDFDVESELAGTSTDATLSTQPVEAECEVPDGEDPETWCDGQAGGDADPVVSDEGTVATENIYSADGDRLVRITRAAATSGGTPLVTGVTAYVGGGQEVSRDAGGQVSAARYYTFAGQTVAMRTGKGMKNVSTLVADHHGTPLVSIPNTDWATEKVVRHHTTPYGAARSADQLPGDHRFMGKTRDTSTGYTLVGARWYDESLGRFLSVDPIMDLVDPQQWHGYAYSHNNPVTYSDPTGLREVASDSLNGDTQDQIKAAVKHTSSGGGWSPTLPPSAPADPWVPTIPMVTDGPSDSTPTTVTTTALMPEVPQGDGAPWWRQMGSWAHDTFLTAEGLAGWTDDAAFWTGMGSLAGLGIQGIGAGITATTCVQTVGLGCVIGGRIFATGQAISFGLGMASSGFSVVNGLANWRLGNREEAVVSFVSAGIGLATAGVGAGVAQLFRVAAGREMPFITEFLIGTGGWGAGQVPGKE